MVGNKKEHINSITENQVESREKEIIHEIEFQ